MSACPPPDVLERLLAEQLEDAESAAVTAHVEECPQCQLGLERLTGALQGTWQKLHALVTIPSALRNEESFLLHLMDNQPAPRGRKSRDKKVGEANEDVRKGPVTAVVAGYEVLSELGRGSTAIVYKARHLQLNRLVALKVFRSKGNTRSEAMVRFRREAETVARLQHANLVQIFEVGEHLGRPFFSLEYLPGGSLAKKLQEKSLPVREAARLVEAAARGIHAAHQQGIIHRDLKPANVLLAADGTPKITDFGLAKQSDNRGQTRLGAILGTPRYMAPEQAQGQTQEIGPLADVHALGIILYECLSGRPLFPGPTVWDTLEQVRSQVPTPLRALRPQVPRDLEFICLKCLQKDPQLRYASAGDLAEDLNRFLEGSIPRERPAPLWEHVLRWLRRHPAAAGLLGISWAILTVLGLAAMSRALLGRNRNAPRLQPNNSLVQAERPTVPERPASRPQVATTKAETKPQTAEEELRALQEAEARKKEEERLRAEQEAEAKRKAEEKRLAELEAEAKKKAEEKRLAELEAEAKKKAEEKRLAEEAEAAKLAKIYPPLSDSLRAWAEELAAWNQAAKDRPAEKDPLNQAIQMSIALKKIRASGMQLPQAAWKDDKAILAVAIPPDGNTMAQGSARGVVRQRELFKGTYLFEVSTAAQVSAIVSLAQAPRANGFGGIGAGDLAAGSENGHIYLLDGPTGKQIAATRGHLRAITTLAYSPDGKSLASGSVDRTVKLWDATLRQGLILRGHKGPVSCLAFTPDNQRLVTGSWDKTFKVWDVATGKEKTDLQAHGNEVTALAVGGDGKSLATASYAWVPGGPATGEIKIWDLATMKLQATFRAHWGLITALAISEDGKLLASGGTDGKAIVWDLAGAKESASVNVPDGNLVLSLRFTPGGLRIGTPTKHGTFRINGGGGGVRAKVGKGRR
jgi:eukaryotic-like serine/threonine-protein kinase